VAGFPKEFTVYAHGVDRKRAAIVTNNKEIDIIIIAQRSKENAILTEIRYKGLRPYGASLYLPIDRDIAGDIYIIENILHFIQGE